MPGFDVRIEQLLRDVRHEQDRDPNRERALVVTKLEEALLWEHRRHEVHGPGSAH